MEIKEIAKKDGLLTEKEMEIYKKPQCSGEELEKIKRFYDKLNIPDIMTLEGMYLIFHKELRVLNLDKINNFEQLCIKRIKYRKYLKRKRNRENQKKRR